MKKNISLFGFRCSFTDKTELAAYFLSLSHDQKYRYLLYFFWRCPITYEILVAPYIYAGNGVALKFDSTNSISKSGATQLQIQGQLTENKLGRQILQNLNAMIDILDKKGIPAELVCSISRSVFTDPVCMLEFGTTYDRSAIVSWLTSSRLPSLREPLEGIPVKFTEIHLRANRNVYMMIEFLKFCYPELKKGAE